VGVVGHTGDHLVHFVQGIHLTIEGGDLQEPTNTTEELV
jgi:hypothetical protein